jgi:hypothetical protein
MTVALRTTLALAASAVCLALSACPALAGSYVVSACSPSTSAGAWAPTNTFPAAFATANACGGAEIGPTDGSDQGALVAQDILNAPANIPNGAAAGWTFTAPAGTTITAIRYYRSLAAYNESDLVAGLFQASGAPLEQCMIPYPFLHGDSIVCTKPNEQAPVTFSGLSTSTLFFGVTCRIVDNATACIDGGAPRHAARADLYSARVTLSEDTPPSVSSVGGGLWGAGVLSGVATVTFAAADATGIRGAVVRSDSAQTLASSMQNCDATLTVPCGQLPAGSVSVDTTTIADGPHTFSLLVSDSAANTQSATSPAVVVDNNGPPPPAGLTATARGTVIALAWQNPISAPQPITEAIAQLCRGATCATPIAVSASGVGQLTAPKPGTYKARLWLLDSARRGGPARAATATVTVPAKSASRITAAIRGSRLRVSGPIAASGRVRVSWRAKRQHRTIASGSRVVFVHRHKLRVAFTLPRRARGAVTRVAVRVGRRTVAHTRARHA